MEAPTNSNPGPSIIVSDDNKPLNTPRFSDHNDKAIVVASKVGSPRLERRHASPLPKIAISTILGRQEFEAQQKPSPIRLSVVSHPVDYNPSVVTEEFVEKFNAGGSGDEQMLKAAFDMIIEMRNKGGLNFNFKGVIDIPLAEVSLARLCGCKKLEIRQKALSALQEIIRLDMISLDNPTIESQISADRILEAMFILHLKMNKEFQQHQLVDLQIEFAKTYGSLAELILRHYAQGHINAIDDNLKSAFRDATVSLERLNRQEDPHLAFYAGFALEAILRLEDDSRKLVGIFARLYHFTLAGVSVYFEDAETLGTELKKTFGKVKLDIQHSWFEKAIRLRAMSASAANNLESLENLLFALEKYRKKHGLPFIIQGIEILSKLAIEGSTEEIRKAAFRGCKMSERASIKAILAGHAPLPNDIKYDDFEKIFSKIVKAEGADLHGLIAYTEYNQLSRSLNAKPILSLRPPGIDNPNTYIRLACLKSLLNIGAHAPDASVRRKAKNAVIQSLKKEKDGTVKNFLKEMVNKKVIPQTGNLIEWANEKGNYANFKPFTTQKSFGSPTSSSDLSLECLMFDGGSHASHEGSQPRRLSIGNGQGTNDHRDTHTHTNKRHSLKAPLASNSSPPILINAKPAPKSPLKQSPSLSAIVAESLKMLSEESHETPRIPVHGYQAATTDALPLIDSEIESLVKKFSDANAGNIPDSSIESPNDGETKSDPLDAGSSSNSPVLTRAKSRPTNNLIGQ